MSKRKRWTPDEDNIIREHYGKMSYQELSEKYLSHRTPASVSRRSAVLGLAGTDASFRPQFKRVLNRDSNFFSKQNPLSSYWAGFIAADGCISERDKALRIGLSSKDVMHLLQFREDIKFDGKVREYVVENDGYGYRELCYISINDPVIYNDLITNFNISPNKTFTFHPKVDMSLNNQFAFIKGYIDGDGSILDRTVKDHNIDCSVTGTQSMVDWVYSLVLDTTESSRLKKHKKYFHRNAFTLRLNGKEAQDFLSLVKNSVNRGLDRKWKNVV